MEKFAQAVTGAAGVAHPKRCVSQGIAALIPDDVRPDEVLAADSDISRCNALVLMRGEMNYELLRTRAATQRFVRVGSKDNAELWVANGDVGTVVHVYDDGKAFEVEFTTLGGKTAAVATVKALAGRPVTGREMTHSRELRRSAATSPEPAVAANG
jgi:hypothetical protein